MPSRREVLSALGVGSVGAAAGCFGRDGQTEEPIIGGGGRTFDCSSIGGVQLKPDQTKKVTCLDWEGGESFMLESGAALEIEG